MSKLTFVHIGDLEPNFRSTAARKVKGQDNPRHRKREEVEAVFACLEHLFEGLRGTGPGGLQRPDIVFFSGDLSGPFLSTKGGSGGSNGYRAEFERLFASWQRLVDGGTEFVWTLASHDDREYGRAERAEPDCWPFVPGRTPSLIGAPGVRLTSRPDSPLVLDVRGVTVAGIGGLGGNRLQNTTTREKTDNPQYAAVRQAKVDETRRRLEEGIAKLQEARPVVVVSSDDQRRSLYKIASYVGLGGIQKTAERAPVGKNPRVHKLGRPVDIQSRQHRGTPSERLQRMDFVWGEVSSTSEARALRVLCPAPPDHPNAPVHPAFEAWAVPWTPTPPPPGA
jgi:hypothetical protein